MAKIDKGLLFFYDWEECFNELPDRDFKEMVMAMIRYKKYGTPPPTFTGITKIAASLIFPQLDRQIEDFENGKKGGRPKKDSLENGDTNNTNKEDFSKASANSQSSAATDEWEELAKIASRKRDALRAERAERARLLGKG